MGPDLFWLGVGFPGMALVGVTVKNMFAVVYIPTRGEGGKLPATDLNAPPCSGDYYQSSAIESTFVAGVPDITDSTTTLCKALPKDTRQAWIDYNKDPDPSSAHPEIFSIMCKLGKPPQVIEPLAGILRDPRFFCLEWFNLHMKDFVMMSIEWLVLADSSVVQSGVTKSILFDAGGTNFMDAMHFFTKQYGSRGIHFDEVYVWEATYQGVENYWHGVPPEVRKHWEPRLTFYDGVPVSPELGAEHNVVSRILRICRPTDFCAFKLDIDNFAVEHALVEQMLAAPKETGAVLDEFFFEHHVDGLMHTADHWKETNGTTKDSYEIFLKLRRMGVRAHSWI